MECWTNGQHSSFIRECSMNIKVGSFYKAENKLSHNYFRVMKWPVEGRDKCWALMQWLDGWQNLYVPNGMTLVTDPKEIKMCKLMFLENSKVPRL